MATRIQEQNLDSLLDTMANVVGILVVLVAVVQLSVGDAVERIREKHVARPPATVEELADALARADATARAVEHARGELAAFDPARLRKGMLVDEMRGHVEELEALAARYEISSLAPRDLDKMIESRRRLIEDSQVQIEQASQHLLDLGKLLADVPAEPRPKVARLPNPRPPPPSAEEIPFFCRYGRIAHLDLAGMREMLDRGIRGALGDNPTIGYGDRSWLINLFAKKRFGSGNFYWDFHESDDPQFWANIRWVDHGFGEGVTDLQSGDSEFVRILSEQTRKGHYLRFYVWSDSFDVYLEARYLAEKMGWDVSWLAVPADEEVGIDLSGQTRSPVVLD